MARIVICILINVLLSCSSGSQKAIHVDTKGITCDACLWNGSVLVSGESSAFADRSSGSTQKDAYLAQVNLTEYTSQLYSVGNKAESFRLDQIAAIHSNIVSSGYGTDNKKAIIAGWSNKLELKWSLVSDSLEAFEEPCSCIDSKGNYLVVSKNTSAQPYYGYFTLVRPDGSVGWTQCADHIDVMSDILALKGGRFLVSFKQKGAYIDGGTMKKYLMATSLWVTIDGAITQKYKFLVDREKFIDFNLYKTLEDSKGNIYYLGSGFMVNNRTDLLIVKTNAEGRVQWSNTYATGKELVIKSADIDAKDQIVIAADSYGKTGGIMLGGVGVDGNIIWNNFITTTPYEQVKNVFWNKDGILIVYDKTLNAGILSCDAKGKNCIVKNTELDIKASNADIQLSPNNAEFEATQCKWLPIQLQVINHKNPSLINDCK